MTYSNAKYICMHQRYELHFLIFFDIKRHPHLFVFMHASSRINNIIITCMIALLHCYCQLSAMASKARSTLSSRRRKRSEEATEPRQLLRPHPESYKGAFDLLNRTSLTKEDVAAYLRGEQSVGPAAINPNEQAYNNRRREIRELAAKVTSDEAEIDEHGRLVPTPRPDVPGAQNPVPQGEPVRPAPPVHPADHEEEERRWLEREDREAAEAIARAVRRLRQAGVPEEDFELIRIPRREQNAVNLTFRRICFAVLAVTTAFVVIMLQTMPLLRTIKQTDLEFDVVLYDLLQVRHFVTHVKHCNGLHRHESNATSLLERLLAWARRNSTTINCADGVLHIPSRQVLLESSSMYQEEYDVLEPYAAGVNVSWFFPCRVPENLEYISDCFPGSNSSSCSTEADPCFRGVHDGIILHREVNGALRLGHHLIQQGGDHIEIHRNTSLLSEWIPSIVTKLEDLLRSQYKLQGHWQPVAFRISVALPMDGTGVRLYGYVGDSLLEHTFNRTVSLMWYPSA